MTLCVYNVGQKSKALRRMLDKYYDLRRKTKTLGITDVEHPRYYSPIPWEARHDLTNEDRNQVRFCIEEEAQYLRIHRLYGEFDKSATLREKREAQRKEEE
jgi:hypothetical protein